MPDDTNDSDSWDIRNVTTWNTATIEQRHRMRMNADILTGNAFEAFSMFDLGLTVREIGEKLDISESQVARLLEEALRRLAEQSR